MLTQEAGCGAGVVPAVRAVVERPGLLRTKLYAPSPCLDAIPRPDLIARLNAGNNARLSLIVAPAGFGKTALAAEWLNALNKGAILNRAVWLTLEDADNDLNRFWRYVIAAFQQVDPAIGARTLSIPGHSTRSSAELWLTSLLTDLEQHAEPITLVLDNYHAIHTVSIHHSLNDFQQHLPPYMRLVLLSRADPPLPLARLRLHDGLTELRAADLRFTLEEIDRYLNERLALGLSSEDIARLEQRTEGWPVGVHLVARLLQGYESGDRRGFIRSFSGSNHLILNYLLEEVLQQQPPATRHFLLRTSVLGDLSAPLCAVLTDQPVDEASSILNSLAHDNLFITPLDHVGHWFQYHSLFAEALATRLSGSDAHLWSEMHRRASRWYADNDYSERAVDHALAAGDDERAAALIEQAGDRTWLGGDIDAPLRRLDALPKAFIGERPTLRLLYIWLLFLHDRWTEATKLWEETGRYLDAQPASQTAAHRGRWAAIGGAMSAHRLLPEETIRLSQQALTLLAPDDHTWHLVSRINLGLAYQAQGNAERAAGSYKALIDECIDQGNLYLAFATLAHLVEVCFAQGRLYEAQAYSERLQELEELPGGQALALRANGNINLGRLAYERGDLPTAERLLLNALGRVWPGGQPRMVLVGRLALADTYEAMGNGPAARCQLDLALEMVSHLQMAVEARIVRARLARSALRENRWDDVRCWQETAGVHYRDMPDFRREFEHIVLAEILIADGMLVQAESLLARLCTAAERHGRAGSALTLSLLYALALTCQKRTAEAETVVRRVLDTAQAQGYVRTLLDFGPLLMELLARPTVRRAFPAYVDRLLRASAVAAQPSRQPAENGHYKTVMPLGKGALREAALAEKLTPRERDILSLIAGGASNQDIADHLVLSVGTVKGHVNHIFGKLDVHSRTAAVARARSMGLLSD